MIPRRLTAEDWQRYGECPAPKCQGRPGLPCTSRRMIGRQVRDWPMPIAHTVRPLLPVPDLAEAEHVDVKVIDALLADMPADKRARVLDYLCAKHGFRPRETEKG